MAATLADPRLRVPPRHICTELIFRWDLGQPCTPFIRRLWYEGLSTVSPSASRQLSSRIYLYKLFLFFRSLVTIEGVRPSLPRVIPHTLPVSRSRLSEHLWLESISLASWAPSAEAGRGRCSSASGPSLPITVLLPDKQTQHGCCLGGPGLLHQSPGQRDDGSFSALLEPLVAASVTQPARDLLSPAETLV